MLDEGECIMSTDIKSNVIDQPAEAGADKLGMNAYAEALAEFISRAQSPLTIALQGEWGSGKTSLMNALKANLVDRKDAPYLGVWINTWQYALMSDAEDSIKNILRGLISQLPEQEKSEQPERKKKAMKLLSTFGRTATVGLANIAGSFVGAGQIGSEFSKVYDAEKKPMDELITDGESPVDKLKKQLESMVTDCCKANSAEEATDGKKCGILIFIDDLDRIDPPVAVQILELLKNIFDIPKCIFVLAIDYGVVVKGLKPKFGAMTDENEREFRSFFDKIIQLPFSMPVASYKIDNFLMDSLADIGYLDAVEAKDEKLCGALTAYALDSVGTNPRSLKRLINYLSLIRLLIGKTEATDDDEDFKNWKDVLFALVCLQVKYQKVYDALQGEGDSDFTAWGETFEQKWRIPPLEEGELEKLKKMDEFDEKWEQMLYRFCRRDKFLADHALFISKILNRVKARITEANQPVGETVQWLLRLSAVTNVKSEPAQMAVPEAFSKSQYLKALRDCTLGMEWPTDCWRADLGTNAAITSKQVRFQSNFSCVLWHSDIKGIDNNRNYLCKLSFHIFHDGKSFQLKAWGEFWGNTPAESFRIDFTSTAIQSDLAAAEATYCAAWEPFGIHAKVEENIGHNPEDIWWNVTVPFKDYDELVSDDFSQKLRGSLTAVANAFASLLEYRVPVNQ